MSTLSKHWTACAIAALAGAIWVGTLEPAQAQFGFGFRGLPFRIQIGPGWGGRYGRRAHRRGAARGEKSDSEETGAPSKEKSDKVLASLGAPSSAQQSAVLKSINASPVLGVVGSTKDLQDVGKPTSKEEDRDYTGSLDKIINKLAGAQDKGLVTPGDVTASGIELALSRAIKDSNLDAFERFASESWTLERIRKLVLDRTYITLDSLLRGTVRGRARMDDVEIKINEAARAIYQRLFEMSELLAANRAANQFIQRLYQATSGRVDPKTLEAADTLVRRGSSTTLAHYDVMLSKDDHAYTHHYRAQRIVYDCLSASVEWIARDDPPPPGETKPVPPSAETLEQRIKSISLDKKDGCDAWLSNQFGNPDPKGTLKAQKPYPMRVVWSKDGPLDDASMYTRGNKL